ncbi:MAG TPA: hypothetical protein VH061_02620 [Solirubrobacteraceae bacterium]|nr:hypothetical protein [Solirubrobacteraceae bacterium]
MTLIVDTASAARRLGAADFQRWAETRTIFLSSEMSDLSALRGRVAGALRDAGFSVVVFEEYLEARRLGKRVSFWLAGDASGRQGNAVDFAQEVKAFHTTGQFADTEDLVGRLLQRLSEIAAEDEAPWIKVGDAWVRADVIRDEGSGITFEAEVWDLVVARYLEGLRSDQWGRSPYVPIARAERAGFGRVTRLCPAARPVVPRQRFFSPSVFPQPRREGHEYGALALRCGGGHGYGPSRRGGPQQ